METLEALNKELLNAAKSGDLKAAEECLKNGAGVHYKDGWNKQTPLYVALENNHKDMAALLVSKGADIKIQYNFELLNAAKSGDLKAAEECLKNGADVHYKDGWNKQTPLYVALKNNHKDMAALLLSKGADIKIQYNFELLNAAKSGDLKAAEECLKNGADVHYKDGWNKQTPLYVALKNNHKDMAALLVSKGADIKIQYNFELLNAAKSGDLKAAKECLKNGADVHYKDGWNEQTPLHVALENNHKDMAALLLSKGADIKIQYNFVCIYQ